MMVAGGGGTVPSVLPIVILRAMKLSCIPTAVSWAYPGKWTVHYTAALTLYLKAGNRTGVSANERGSRIFERKMRERSESHVPLLEICFTKSWQAGLMCIAQQMWSVSEVQRDFGLWMLPLAVFWWQRKTRGGWAPIFHGPHISARSGRGKPSCYRASSALWEVLHSERTQELGSSLSLCWWSQVEQKP